MLKTTFDIGYDHYRFNIPLEISRYIDEHRKLVHDGYMAAETLSVTKKKPNLYEKKLLGIRDRALTKGLEASITVDDLHRCFLESKGMCPIILEPFTFAEDEKTDWSVDRIDNTKGYSSDNIVIVSRLANLAKSNLELSGIIKQSLRSPEKQSLLTSEEWLRMAKFYYPKMKLNRPLSTCLILSEYQPLYDGILIMLLQNHESKNSMPILSTLNKYTQKDCIFKAAKLTKKRFHHSTHNPGQVLYRSPKLYACVKSFIETINAHSSEFDPLFMKYLFA